LVSESRLPVALRFLLTDFPSPGHQFHSGIEYTPGRKS
jgi:hypothetical protein